MAIITDIFVVFSILSYLCYGLFKKENYKYISILILTLSLYLLLTTPLVSYNIPYTIIINENIVIIKSLLYIVTIVILFLNKIITLEFHLLLLLSLLGITLLLSSENLIMLYLSLELFSLSSYILAAYEKKNKYSLEAGIKYFILGSLSSGILLFGISMIYGSTGTLKISELITLTNISNLGKLGGLLILIGLLFKLAAAPFHVWIPDVYQGSPTIVTTYFAIIPKLSLLFVIYILFRYQNTQYLNNIFYLTAILSLIIGSIGTIMQLNLKRFYAYSSIAHIGYLLIAISILNIDGLQSLIIYIFFYIIMGILFFSIILNLPYENTSILYLGGLYSAYPFLATSFSIYLLSSAGVPPLAGFFSKYYVLIAALHSNLKTFVLFAIIISVISSFYYLRLIVYMYFSPIQFTSTLTISYSSSIIISITSLILMLFFLNPSMLIKYSNILAYSLLCG